MWLVFIFKRLKSEEGSVDIMIDISIPTSEICSVNFQILTRDKILSAITAQFDPQHSKKKIGFSVIHSSFGV